MKRHFFRPRDWTSPASLQLVTYIEQGTVLCPRNDEAAIVTMKSRPDSSIHIIDMSTKHRARYGKYLGVIKFAMQYAYYCRISAKSILTLKQSSYQTGSDCSFSCMQEKYLFQLSQVIESVSIAWCFEESAEQHASGSYEAKYSHRNVFAYDRVKYPVLAYRIRSCTKCNLLIL